MLTLKISMNENKSGDLNLKRADSRFGDLGARRIQKCTKHPRQCARISIIYHSFLLPCQIIHSPNNRLRNEARKPIKKKKRTTLIDTSSEISDSASFNLCSLLNHPFKRSPTSYHSILLRAGDYVNALQRAITAENKVSPISLESLMTNAVRKFFPPSRRRWRFVSLERRLDSCGTGRRLRVSNEFSETTKRRREVNHRSLRGFYSRERISRGNTRAAVSHRSGSCHHLSPAAPLLLKHRSSTAVTRHFVWSGQFATRIAEHDSSTN